MLTVWFALLATTAFAQTASVTHNVYLRTDSSSEVDAIRKLLVGEKVTLIDAEPEDGFYHVRTADNEEGWVWRQFIRIEVDAVAPLVATAAPAGGDFDPSWDKPQPNLTSFTSGGKTCGDHGDNDETETNRRKNRTDHPPTVHDVTFKALVDLPYPNAAKERSGWTMAQLNVIKPYEGVAVRVEGYLVALKPQTGGTGESTNCHMTRANEVDWHMALVAKNGEGEEKAVVVETTPRVRKTHPKWTATRLRPYVDSTSKVRITGWTFLDPEHRNHLGKYRATLWEVHPITKIEVKQGAKWVDLDQLP